MKRNKHREPILYIVGNEERAEEIKHIIEDEWGGRSSNIIKYNNNQMAYHVSTMGCINFCNINFDPFKESIANGWMREYKLPEKTKFKPFDKVVVKDAEGCTWKAAFYSHESSANHIMTNSYEYQYCLPYNEQTAKLIGTRDEWKGGDDE